MEKKKEKVVAKKEEEELVQVGLSEKQLESMMADLGLPPGVKMPPITKKQKALIEIPADELPETQIFEPVPLVARLTTGVENVRELSKR